MDGLSSAASAFAVVSLAGQLVSGIKNIIDFWESMRGAPDFIQEMLYELRLLAAVLERIQTTSNLRVIDPLLVDALKSCDLKVQSFINFMNNLKPAYLASSRSIRTWKSFKAAFQGDKINSFRLSVGETKTTLFLIRQDLAERLQYSFQEQMMSAIANGFSDLKLETQSRTVTTTVESNSEVKDHIEDLQTEIRQITRTMSNPIYRSAYEAGFNSALEKLAKFLPLNDHAQSRLITPPLQIKSNPEPVLPPVQPADLESGREGDTDQRRVVTGTQMSVARTPIGVFQVHFRKSRVVQASSRIDSLSSMLEGFDEYQTSLRYHPAQWLMNWSLITSGVDVLLSNSVRGWKNTLRTFRAVPDNSPIFELCRTANIDAVRTLLASGHASPMDTNSLGWTPLHFAAYECDMSMCQLLVNSGADHEALTYDFPLGNYEICSPLVAAATLQRDKIVPYEHRTRTLKLLMKSTDLDFSANNSQAWKLILVLLERSRPSSGFTDDSRAATWIIDIFQDEIRQSCPPENLFWLTLFCLEDPHLLSRLLKLRPEAANVRVTPLGFSLLHCKIAENFPLTILSSFRVLVEHGSELHSIGRTVEYGADTLGRPIFETPTSLTMRRSLFFDQWRRFITDLGIDIEEFVFKELQLGPLRKRGWTSRTLLTLFNHPFVPHLMPKTECVVCSREVFCLYSVDEAWWEQFLVDICDLETSDGTAGNNSDSGSDEFFSLEPSNAATHPQTQEPAQSTAQRLLCWKCEMMQQVRDETKSSGSTKFTERVP
ncbi:hypothetical protein F5Y14DRAFT_436227 [Nemania sp. NC0429]|nr:hypothetical protein F5Y14DRAFT_436227 [Nemania sp. NC0429]